MPVHFWEGDLAFDTEDEIISLRKAAGIVGVSHTTVHKWCEKYGIGDRDGHRWLISRQRLLRVHRQYIKARAILAPVAQ